MKNIVEAVFLTDDKVRRIERYTNFSKAVREVNKIFGYEKIPYNTVKRLKFPIEYRGVYFSKIKIQ